jgi:hypothetical protein
VQIDLNCRPSKTADGTAELQTRARRLSQRLRTVLVLVDGKRTAAQVQDMARQVGAPPEALNELAAQGFIDAVVLEEAVATVGEVHAAAVPVVVFKQVPAHRHHESRRGKFRTAVGRRATASRSGCR